MPALGGPSVPFSLSDSSQPGQWTGADIVLFAEKGSGQAGCYLSLVTAVKYHFHMLEP